MTSTGRIPRALMTCSQWGVHPHEAYPEHDATGIAKMILDGSKHPEVPEIFAICQRCANELHLNTGWPRYCKPDDRFSWIQKPWKPGT